MITASLPVWTALAALGQQLTHRPVASVMATPPLSIYSSSALGQPTTPLSAEPFLPAAKVFSSAAEWHCCWGNNISDKYFVDDLTAVD